MSDYTPPIDQMLFILCDVLGFEHEELDRETLQAVLGEAAKLSSEVLAPLNKVGDEQGARLENGKVYTADGFKEAYAEYRDAGWNSVPFDPEYGGQGLPWAAAFAVQEMWQGANMSFGLCPLLNQGAVEAIFSHGSQEQKDQYLSKLISGEWTGTMNLTESQAGSDLGLIRSKAEKQSDDTYKITGQKIYITYGDHDMAENIIHLVLARTPDAPEDVKGISLFIVPKILENGEENTLSCIGLEHKLGIHASPTCTMDFDGATGYLIGEEGSGLKYMFTMMNNARLSVGLQGVAIAERAYQHALAYANDRVQGKSMDSGERVTISHHADVRRMLMDCRTKILAGRLMTYMAAIELDKADGGDRIARAKVDFLTPLVKSWCTDMAVDVASTGIQIFGGMGFVEETGAAQFYRDARILPIYEGTNGIQAMDLVFRKILRDDGRVAKKTLLQFETVLAGNQIETAITAINEMIGQAKSGDMDAVAYKAKPLLDQISYIIGAGLIAQAASKHPDFEVYSGVYLKDITT